MIIANAYSNNHVLLTPFHTCFGVFICCRTLLVLMDSNSHMVPRGAGWGRYCWSDQSLDYPHSLVGLFIKKDVGLVVLSRVCSGFGLCNEYCVKVHPLKRTLRMKLNLMDTLWKFNGKLCAQKKKEVKCGGNFATGGWNNFAIFYCCRSI